MSALNRRGFLRGAAAALPASGLALTPVLAQAALSAENPELLALAPELDAAERAFAAADARKREARAAYEALAPDVPDELVFSRDDHRLFCGEREVDVEGRCLYRGREGMSRTIATVRNLEIEVQDYGPRSKAGRTARRRLKIARQFEAAKAKAFEASGFEQADRDRIKAAGALERVAARIGDAEVRTFTGLGIKARAMIAVSKADEINRIRAAFLWGVPLAEAVSAMA